MCCSPASGACSTNSAGSSLSVDGEGVGGEGGWAGLDSESRYGHSLTPDEPVILEENTDDYAPWQTGQSIHFTDNAGYNVSHIHMLQCKYFINVTSTFR